MNPAQHTLLVEQLRKGRGVTDTLTALAEDTDTPHDRVRRARLLRELLQELDRGALAIDCLNHRKVSRFLAFLEREIAWLETSQALEPPRPPCRGGHDEPLRPARPAARREEVPKRGLP